MPRISATCPHCLSCYQVEPNLRGTHMRCPNSLCRAIFEVRDEDNDGAGNAASTPNPPATAAEAQPKQVTGTVGQMVPIVRAEIAEVTSPSPQAVPSLIPLVSAEAV